MLLQMRHIGHKVQIHTQSLTSLTLFANSIAPSGKLEPYLEAILHLKPIDSGYVVYSA